MLLNLIYGGAGSGKTQRCIELIENTLKKNPGHNAVLTVPDQYSYTAEKRLAERFGGTGPNGIEVLTFTQFFKRYVKRNGNYLSPSGKEMLVYSAVMEQEKNESSIFRLSAKKPGFVGKASELISEMKRYLVSPDDLKKAAKEDEGSILSKKLEDFSKIYENYNGLLDGGFLDSEDDCKRFCEFLLNSRDFENTHIWFDGFSDFLPQHYEIIRAFLIKAQSVHVTLCMPFSGAEQEIFKTPASAAKRLKKICADVGARLLEEACGDVCRTVESPEILHLLNNWDNRRNKFKGRVENISIFCARDIYSETEYTAGKILEEIRKGARFRDISVLCADMQQYSHMIEAVFGDCEIPYFSDTEKPLTDHPIIMTVLGAFEITEENWSYESVFKYLRAGFLYRKGDNGIEPVDRELIDKLENYVLRRGIRGKSTWLADEDWGENSGGVFEAVLGEYRKIICDMEEINAVRREVTEPFKSFYEKISGRRTVKEMCAALYEFLLEIHMYEGIGIEIGSLNSAGMRNEAERMKEIWNLLMEVINQAAVTSGDRIFSRKHFCMMIRAGLSSAALRIIPTGLDRVSVGAADRNSPLRCKIIFFMGAVAGTLPSEPKTGGILTDSERKMLEEKGVETAGDASVKIEREMFKFYRTAASASEKLYFSYPAADIEGAAKQPSVFLKELYQMFPDMNVSDDLAEEDKRLIFNKKQAFLYIMRSVSDKRIRKRAEMTADFFCCDSEFADRLHLAKYAYRYKKVQPQISKESAKLLYNNYHRYSVSRLNDYSACPFSYFVKHGLKAREQEVWKIQKFEIGSLLHWAVLEYCKEVEDGAEDLPGTAEKWRNLDEEKSNEIAERIMEDISLRVLERLSVSRGRVRYLLERMKRILLRSVEIVRLSLSKGDYTAVCYEQKFEIEIEWNKSRVGLNGTIDRVDADERVEEGKIALRIIDYKSGSKAFNVVSVSNKSDMQLLVYAIAATELYKKGALGRASRGLEPSVRGILYNKLRNDIVKTQDNNPGKLRELLKSNMKLDGLVISDGDELETAFSMDESLRNGESKSEFMKLALNSKKDALDKRYSQTESREKFDLLVDFVKKTVVKIDEEIFDGRISPQPSGSKSKNACSYCKYKEICLFDARFDIERKEIEKVDEAWEYIENEVANKEI